MMMYRKLWNPETTLVQRVNGLKNVKSTSTEPAITVDNSNQRKNYVKWGFGLFKKEIILSWQSIQEFNTLSISNVGMFFLRKHC